MNLGWFDLVMRGDLEALLILIRSRQNQLVSASFRVLRCRNCVFEVLKFALGVMSICFIFIIFSLFASFSFRSCRGGPFNTTHFLRCNRDFVS